jgi:hypothetical protein
MSMGFGCQSVFIDFLTDFYCQFFVFDFADYPVEHTIDNQVVSNIIIVDLISHNHIYQNLTAGPLNSVDIFGR